MSCKHPECLKLAELLGIEGKVTMTIAGYAYNSQNEVIGYKNRRKKEVLPCFQFPENFVKLLESLHAKGWFLSIGSGGRIFLGNVFKNYNDEKSYLENVINTVFEILKEHKAEKTKPFKVLKTHLQQTDWRY